MIPILILILVLIMIICVMISEFIQTKAVIIDKDILTEYCEDTSKFDDMSEKVLYVTSHACPFTLYAIGITLANMGIIFKIIIDLGVNGVNAFLIDASLIWGYIMLYICITRIINRFMMGKFLVYTVNSGNEMFVRNEFINGNLVPIGIGRNRYIIRAVKVLKQDLSCIIFITEIAIFNIIGLAYLIIA